MSRKLKIKKIESQIDLQTFFKLMEREINSLIGKIVSTTKIPDDPFHSKKNKLRKDLFHAVGKGDCWKRIPHGFKLIMEGIESHLSESELNAQKEAFAQAMEKIEL